MRNAGWVLYVVGVCLGAFGGTRIPVWWAVFLPGIAVVVVGTLLIRRAAKADGAASAAEHAGKGDGEGAEAHLRALEAETARLSTEDLTIEAIKDGVETLLLERALPFADGRQHIAERFGVAAFAEVMSPFATGERYLNRAWSAAVDHHPDECRASVKVAAAAFVECHEAWRKVASAAS